MASTQAGIESFFRASALFGVLDPDAMKAMGPHVVRRRYARGDRLWRAGEQAHSMALIASGLVKIVHPGGAIIAILGTHETFGELAVVGGNPYSADAVAGTRETEVFFIDASAVRRTFTSNFEFAQAMSRSLVGHGRVLHEKIRIMSAGCVERRLAALLQHLLDRFGDELEDGSTVIQVGLSRAELACLVGATLETTIRLMSRWKREGIVTTTPDGFIVHAPERLDELLGSSAVPRQAAAGLSVNSSNGQAPRSRGEEPPSHGAQ